MAGCGGAGEQGVPPGTTQLFLAATDGSGVHRITDDASHVCAAWSPDGRRISSVREHPGDANRSREVELRSSGGEDARGLDVKAAPAGSCPAWSPDGRKLAFPGLVDGGQRLVVVDPNSPDDRFALGSAVAVGWREGPSWSRDGRRVVVASIRPSPCPPGAPCPPPPPPPGPRPTLPQGYTQGDLMLVDVDRRRSRLITDTPTLSEANPRLSPDGRTVAFVRTSGILRRRGQVKSISLVGLGGGRPRVLVRGIPGLEEHRPQWSPDGRWIVAAQAEVPGVAYVASPGGRIRKFAGLGPGVSWSRDGRLLASAGIGGLELVSPATGGRRVLARGRGGLAHVLAWSPDGSRLAYADAGALKVISKEGGTARVMYRLKPRHSVMEVTWSPDGKRLLFAVFRQSPET